MPHINKDELYEWKLRVFCTHCGHHYDDVYRNKLDSVTSSFDGVCPKCGKLESFAARVARVERTETSSKTVPGGWLSGPKQVRTYKNLWMLHEDALPLYDLTEPPGSKTPTPDITVHPKMMLKIVAGDISKEKIDTVLPQDSRRGFRGHVR